MPFISPHTIPTKNPNSFAKHTTTLLLSYTHYLTLHILKIHISCCPYLYTPLSSLLLHNLIHTYYTITYNTPQLFQTPLSFSLTLKFYCFAAHKHISILFYTYPTTPISIYLNTSSYLSLTKSFLLESNLYDFSNGYNPIFLLSLTSISLILPYIIHITNITSHKTFISLPSPHFSRDTKHPY